MNKLIRWFEGFFDPNTAAARRSAEEVSGTPSEGGNTLIPVILAKPVYDESRKSWVVESTQELSVGDEVRLFRPDVKFSIVDAVIKGRITDIISTVSPQGKFLYGIDIKYKEPTDDRDTDSHGSPLP